MALTNIQFCFDDAEKDIVCIAQHPEHPEVIAAGSEDNRLYIFDVAKQTALARIEDFADTVTQVTWTSSTQFLACSLDGSIRLYQFDPAQYPVPLLVGESANQTSLSQFKIYKQLVLCQSEDSQFYVLNFANPAQPQLTSCVYVEGLADFLLVNKSLCILVGKQVVMYDVKTNEQHQVTMQNSAISDAKPVCAYHDKVKNLAFIGYDSGVVEVFQIQPTKLIKIQGLNGITTAGVNIIDSCTIFGNQYFYVGTNDALYIYESNFVLRNCVKLQNQGVSVFQLQVREIGQNIVQRNLVADQTIAQSGQTIEIAQAQQGPQFSHVQLVCGLTDGEIAVFDALSLEKICSFDALQTEDETDKPVLAMANVANGIAVTGDRFLYVYDNNFEEIGAKQRQLEEVSLEAVGDEAIE